MSDVPIPAELELSEATLTFREQADGRKVSRLPGGKVVLLKLSELGRVADGEQWRVRLSHRDTFAIAEPIERVRGFSNPVLDEQLVGALRAGSRESPPGLAERRVALGDGADAAEVEHGRAPAVGEEAGARAFAPGDSAPSREAASVDAPPDPRRLLRPDDRVALFVDGANMDHACREAGYFIDYRKAREFLVGGAVCYAAYYYVADLTATDPLQQSFLDFLTHAGYIVRRKPVKVIRDQDTGERIIKANVDLEIVLDMLNTVGNYDVAFLLSGDSDFERAIELLRSRGKRVYVVTSRRALSRELAYVADKPIFLLEALRAAIGRADRAPAPRAGDRQAAPA
ncbi:MAG TPA: NYN domain-containing protein [Vicinamibacterales bacterium]|nr:NYN domain-containing protein [Vicinamibacterales bacterium]